MAVFKKAVDVELDNMIFAWHKVMELTPVWHLSLDYDVFFNKKKVFFMLSRGENLVKLS